MVTKIVLIQGYSIIPLTTFIPNKIIEKMPKEKSPSKNSAKKEAVLSLKEKRAAKAAKKKNRS